MIIMNHKLNIAQSKFLPRKVFFTKGIGSHRDALVSFELALRDAGIEKFNLVATSSILPPHCKIVTPEEGLVELSPGQIVFCVLAKMTSNKKGKRICASIGVAIPPDPALNGYLAEYQGYCNGIDAAKHAENNAAHMLRTAFGVEPAKTFSITAQAEVTNYTTAIAAAVFIL